MCMKKVCRSKYKRIIKADLSRVSHWIHLNTWKGNLHLYHRDNVVKTHF